MNRLLCNVIVMSIAAAALSGCTYRFSRAEADPEVVANGYSKLCVAKKSEASDVAASRIFLDDNAIAELKVGEWFCTTIPSGDHSFQVEYTSLGSSFLSRQEYYYLVENSGAGQGGKPVTASFFDGLTSAADYTQVARTGR